MRLGQLAKRADFSYLSAICIHMLTKFVPNNKHGHQPGLCGAGGEEGFSALVEKPWAAGLLVCYHGIAFTAPVPALELFIFANPSKIRSPAALPVLSFLCKNLVLLFPGVAPKSPWEKGGFRGISGAYKIPPNPPFSKGGIRTAPNPAQRLFPHSLLIKRFQNFS